MLEATDWQIDALVYELHGLSEEEIGVVERYGFAPIRLSSKEKGTWRRC